MLQVDSLGKVVPLDDIAIFKHNNVQMIFPGKDQPTDIKVPYLLKMLQDELNV